MTNTVARGQGSPAPTSVMSLNQRENQDCYNVSQPLVAKAKKRFDSGYRFFKNVDELITRKGNILFAELISHCNTRVTRALGTSKTQAMRE